MTKFPWAYIVPGRQYFKLLRIAKACPEIAHLIHKKERLRLKMIGLMALTFPYVVLMVTPALVAILTQWLTDRLDRINWPNPYRPIKHAMDQTTYEAHKILPWQEIRRRITA